MRDRYVLWGYARSWIVHRVNAAGRIVWCSEWMSNRPDADGLRERMEAGSHKVSP